MPTGRIARAAHARDRLEQPARVRMPRVAEELVGRALLDDAAAVHDDHAVGELAHDAEVVADVDDRGMRRRAARR